MNKNGTITKSGTCNRFMCGEFLYYSAINSYSSYFSNLKKFIFISNMELISQISLGLKGKICPLLRFHFLCKINFLECLGLIINIMLL